METQLDLPTSRKAVYVAPSIHARLMQRLTAYRASVGYKASLNELVAHLLQTDANANPTEIQVRFEPVELRADSASLRSVVKADSYQLLQTS